jgi:hypothetical protein
MLGLISAFVCVQNCNKYYLDEKALQSTTFWMNFKEIFFSYYIVWLEMLFLIILLLLEHFKGKHDVASNKSLFLKE